METMRSLSFILLIIGLCLAGRNAFEEYHAARGDAGYILVEDQMINRRSPEDFRRGMTVRWVSAGLMLFMGVAMYVMVRREERLDPLSPDFKWPDEKVEPEK